MKRSVKFIVGPHCSCGVGLGVVQRLNAVVDAERRAVLELELPAGHDVSPSVTPLRIATWSPRVGPGGDEDLLRWSSAWPFASFFVHRDEHGGAVGVVGDRRLRQRQVALLLAGIDRDAARTCRAATAASALATVASIWTLRVVASTFGLIAVDLAAEGLSGVGIAQHRHRLTRLRPAAAAVAAGRSRCRSGRWSAGLPPCRPG